MILIRSITQSSSSYQSLFKVSCYSVWLEDRHPNGYIPGNIPLSRQYHYGVGVLWVSVHPAFNNTLGEKNVALLTTIWRLQFSSSLYQICLPMPDASDTNIGNELEMKRSSLQINY